MRDNAVIAAVIVMFGFGYFAAFYRASALEMKRLDAMLRSILYAHLSESLTGADCFLLQFYLARLTAARAGLPTIRSYGEIPRFIRDNKYYIDLENRALFLTVTNQRWLAVCLDALGSILVFLVRFPSFAHAFEPCINNTLQIGIFSAVGIPGVSAAQIGLILTYASEVLMSSRRIAS